MDNKMETTLFPKPSNYVIWVDVLLIRERFDATAKNRSNLKPEAQIWPES